MSTTLKIEEAYVKIRSEAKGEFLGYRISVGGVPCLLVYEDQNIHSGFRFGDKFPTQTDQETVSYLPTSIMAV